jgi:hypothetical protein
MNTPILLLIFNRPDLTQQVFQAIRLARPRRLFVAADGPRPGNALDQTRCLAARDVVAEVDWDCEVKTLFRDKNLGCKQAVSSAIAWFFQNVEEGIILEDDCLPDQSFFPYCTELLEHYRQDERIFMISGDNFLSPYLKIKDSYYFSRLPHIWGWASWRRAWQYYDVTMADWPEFIEQRRITKIWSDPKIMDYWLKIFQAVHNNQIDTWDYQVAYAMYQHNGLSITPAGNLIANIGFGTGTHTLDKSDKNAQLAIKPISFPLRHPASIIENSKADNYENYHLYLAQSALKKILKQLGLFNLTKKIYKYVMQNLRHSGQ